MRYEPLLFALALPACGDQSVSERAREHADQAVKAAEAAAQTAADDASKAVEAGAVAAVDSVKDEAANAAEKIIDTVKDPANLSAAARAALAAAGSDGSIESLVAAGTQLAPAVADMTGPLGDVVDRETTVEPIYQDVGDVEARNKVDAAIGDMPRTEVIDGLTVGFRDLSSMDTQTHVSESGYLVVWRQGDHLVGFVYRSRREISLDKLVGLAPRMIAATRSALDLGGAAGGAPGGDGSG